MCLIGPHLSIPRTEAGRSRRHYGRLVNRSPFGLHLMIDILDEDRT